MAKLFVFAGFITTLFWSNLIYSETCPMPIRGKDIGSISLIPHPQEKSLKGLGADHRFQQGVSSLIGASDYNPFTDQTPPENRDLLLEKLSDFSLTKKALIFNLSGHGSAIPVMNESGQIEFEWAFSISQNTPEICVTISNHFAKMGSLKENSLLASAEEMKPTIK